MYLNTLIIIWKWTLTLYLCKGLSYRLWLRNIEYGCQPQCKLKSNSDANVLCSDGLYQSKLEQLFRCCFHSDYIALSEKSERLIRVMFVINIFNFMVNWFTLKLKEEFWLVCYLARGFSDAFISQQRFKEGLLCWTSLFGPYGGEY